MCQNSISGMQSEQIRKFVENGMPEKIVKTVQYTLRKRAAEQHSAMGNIKTISTSDHHSDNHNANDAHILDKVDSISIPRLCGRFRKLQAASKWQDKITNVGASGTEAIEDNKALHHRPDMDALAVTTQMSKQFVQRLHAVAEKMQNSKIYKLLTKTTQPAHLIAVGVLTFVLFTVWPNIVGTRKTSDTTDTEGSLTMDDRRPQRHSTLAAIAYLGAFATHFGAQIWMTFVSGLSLYFSLPRHTFGQCQQILFPRYFAMSSVLSISMLILFLKYFLNTWNVAAMVQLIALGTSAFIEVIIRLYLAPPMLRLMLEKYRIEGAIGSGREVGTLDQGDLIKCPHYQRIHKTFRRIHMTIAMGNMTVLLATCLHLYFLASKIQIS